MTVLAVDGTNIAMRYACAILGDRRRDPSDDDVRTVLYAVERAILSCAKAADCDELVIAVDSGRSFRHEIYPAYKANREAGSTGPWSERLKHWRRDWPVLAVEGFEADDILATIASRRADSSLRTVILSSDSDLLQLLTDVGRVEVWKPIAGTWYSIEKFKLYLPSQVALFKALVGETGDHIPGVRGIGPVRARKILSTLPTADEIRLLLRSEQVDEFDLAMQLVVLREDVPLEDPIPTVRIL